MFSNFAWSEILVIAVVAIIVVGPKDLPGMLRQIGKALGSVRRMGNEFQRQFNDAVKEAELDDLKDLTSTKGFSPLEDAKRSMENFTKTVEDSVSGVDIDSDVEPVTAEAGVAKKTAKPAKRAASKTTKPAAKRSTSKTAATKSTAAAKPTSSKGRTAAKPRTRKTAAKPAAKSAKSKT